MNRYFFLLTLIGLLTSTRLHDFHTSITRVDYNARERSWEVSIRVFTDDLENALGKDNNGQKFVVVNTDKNGPFVEKYVRKHFAFINAKNQKKAFTYVGKEQEADATWIYVEVPMNEPVAGFSLQNAIMHDLFDDQTNLVNLNYQGTRKSYIFKKGESVLELGI
ncbi:MAG: hypothetical protein MUE30_15350 [Spirosomaceae bacterium]|nr:hypothetical protein [Spirosomataceae bacterium]